MRSTFTAFDNPPPRAFTRGAYSFRPIINNGLACYQVFPKGDRSGWSSAAMLYGASDGACWIVSMTGEPVDARPSLSEACDLVMARLPREG